MIPTLSDSIALADITLRMGEVQRATLHPHRDAGRQESLATHTLMLCMLAGHWATLMGLDPLAAIRFAMHHDLPEIVVGDIDTTRALTAEQRALKGASEAEALARIEAEASNHPMVLDSVVWARMYEEQDAAEARLVRILDKILPKLTHALNGGAALRLKRQPLDLAEVIAEHLAQGAELRARYPEYAESALMNLFDEACRVSERAYLSHSWPPWVPSHAHPRIALCPRCGSAAFGEADLRRTVSGGWAWCSRADCKAQGQLQGPGSKFKLAPPGFKKEAS